MVVVGIALDERTSEEFEADMEAFEREMEVIERVREMQEDRAQSLPRESSRARSWVADCL